MATWCDHGVLDDDDADALDGFVTMGIARYGLSPLTVLADYAAGLLAAAGQRPTRVSALLLALVLEHTARDMQGRQAGRVREHVPLPAALEVLQVGPVARAVTEQHRPEAGGYTAPGISRPRSETGTVPAEDDRQLREITADSAAWEQLRSATAQALENYANWYGPLGTSTALLNQWIHQYRVRHCWLDIPTAAPLLASEDG